MKIKNIKAIAYKETLQVFRDPSSILIAFILPLILLFLMGYAVSLDSKNIKFGIVSHSNLTNDLISNFMASKFFNTEVGSNKEEFIQKIKKNDIKALLIIEDDFYKTHKIQLLLDGSEPNTAGLIAKYSSQIIKNWEIQNKITNKLEKTNPINLQTQMRFNSEISSRYFIIPGSIAVIMTLISTLLTALVITREWERGTMEALLATPISMNEIIIAKLIPYLFLALGSMLICFLVAFFWYNVPFRGSILILIIMSIVYLFPSLTMGLFISSLTKSQFVSAQAAIIAGFLPAFLISGAIFEINNMPELLQYFSYLIHARYFVSSLQTIFLVGDVYRIFIFDIIGMIIVGMLFFILVNFKLKRSLDWEFLHLLKKSFYP